MNNTRHSGIFSIYPSASVDIIGAGGLGATTALTLAKMGYRYMTIYDGDVVSEENTGTQLHKPSDIGNAKVLALALTIEEFSDDISINAMYERVTAETPLYSPIIISAVDSINARKDIWQAVCKSKAEWYLEMRMAAEEYQAHTINLRDNNDVIWYDDYISGQSEEAIPELACTMKSTFFTAMGASGFAGEAVRKIHTGIKPPRKLVMNFLSGTYMEI